MNGAPRRLVGLDRSRCTMELAPETRYVDVGGRDVAFQVLGDGPDLLWFHGIGGSHLELVWDIPQDAAFLCRLASFSRLILFDRRGTGASDPIHANELPTWETWAEDIGSVLDAVGTQRASIFAALDSGPLAVLFAASHPERVSSLILFNTTARFMADSGYPVGESADRVDELVELVGSLWGTVDLVRGTSPTMQGDDAWVEKTAKALRANATPRAARAQYQYLLRHMDVREFLPLVQAPTLVLHTLENEFVPSAQGRFLADHIEGASFLGLSGGSLSVELGDREFTDILGQFVTGEVPPDAIDRILTTVLFTDIVGSTEQLTTVGDRRWRELLDTHDRIVRECVHRFRGREIETAGDAFVVTFDGPARAIHCGQAILAATSEVGLRLRIGLHTGECEIRGTKIGGIAVHTAARINALCAPDEVWVSSVVTDLVRGSGIAFLERGLHAMKGIPGEWELFAVAP
jgi:class 3 adenylate cyclase/pimeloyl-ACP methyl ester carboxylesterase